MATVIIVLLLALLLHIAKSEMIYTGVGPKNPSVVDVIKYIYHGLF
ncbi:hypothetical protein [Bacillus sp. AFS023182]|nr:hypothetical protein [Bacillus sp. AFS023182]